MLSLQTTIDPSLLCHLCILLSTIVSFRLAAITRKRLAEEKKLNQGLERFTNLQQRHVHEKETESNKRKDQNITTDQGFKDADRKVQLTT